MDKRRSAVVAVAVLLAVLAAVAVFVFLKDSDESNRAAPGDKQVLVAAGNIPANTKVSQILSAGLAKVEGRPRNSVPADAILTLDELNAPANADLVTVGSIPGTTTLARSLFVQPGQLTASFNSSLEADEQLITVPAAQLKTLTAGLLKPGDRVNVIITTTAYQGAVDGGEAAAPAADANGAAAQTQVTGYMLQGIEVYAVGASTATPLLNSAQTQAGQSAAVVTSADVTFRVNAIQAEKLVRALHGGATPTELWLTLVSQDFGKATTAAITNKSLLTGNYVDGGAAKEPDAPIVTVTSSTTSAKAAASQ